MADKSGLAWMPIETPPMNRSSTLRSFDRRSA
jgi:hypothetical protein